MKCIILLLLFAVPAFAQQPTPTPPQICWTQTEPLSPAPFVLDWRLWINGVAQPLWPRAECVLMTIPNPMLGCTLGCLWCHPAPLAAQGVGTVLAMDALDGGSASDPKAWSDLSNTKVVVATNTPTPIVPTATPTVVVTNTVPLPTPTPQRPTPPALVQVQ